MRLREIMMQKDLENVTCKEVRGLCLVYEHVNSLLVFSRVLGRNLLSLEMMASDAVYHQPKALVFRNET